MILFCVNRPGTVRNLGAKHFAQFGKQECVHDHSGANAFLNETATKPLVQLLRAASLCESSSHFNNKHEKCLKSS